MIFNENLGKIAEQYCKKGAKVYLEGQLQTREFTDKEGNQRKTTEVVLQRFRGELTCSTAGAGAARIPLTAAPPAAASAGSPRWSARRLPAVGGFGGGAGGGMGGRASDSLDDDIPF